MTKVVVIGLDGATWDLLKPWADNGELPALKKLMENGVWGTLESTIPPVTGPAWTSFSTGKNPGKHGIFDFVKIENNSLRLHQSKDIGGETIHEILSKGGLRSIVIGLPLSFPPSSYFKGIMISDFLYAGKEIIPKSKTEYIENYRVFPNIALRGADLIEDMLETARSQIEVAKQLFVSENWDFYFFYFFAIDGVGHNFWRDIRENTTIGQKAKEIFHIADEFLSWVSDKIDKETTLFLISDHGFADCPFSINLNNVLKEKDVLRTKIKKTSEAPIFGKHLIDTFGIQKHWAISLREYILKIASNPLIESISKRIFKANFIVVRDTVIDLDNSKAFVATSESMSIHIRETERKKYEEIIKDIVETLRKLEYRGQMVFKEVLIKDEVYSGPFIESAPDILLIPNGFHISSSLGNEIYSAFDTGGWHDLRGIFLAYGYNIKTSSEEQKKLKIYDIMPTILYIFGLPIPRDMDGRVLKVIFDEQSGLAKAEIMYYETQHIDEKWRLKEKIEKLRGNGKT